MAIKNWNGFKKSGDTYIPNDATARAGIGTLSSLLTTVKDNLVAAINEVVTKKISWADAGKSVKKNYAQITIASGKVDHNITFTVANDKKISTSGTTNSDNRTDVGVAYLEAGTYIFSGNPANSGLRIRLFNSDDSHIFWNEPGEENTITIPTSEKYTIGLRYGNNANLSGKVFAIMIRLASILDNTYAENIPDNTELMTWEANAKVGVHNILQCNKPSATVKTVECTVGADESSVTLNGSPDDGNMAFEYYVGTFPKGNYKISGGDFTAHGVRVHIRWLDSSAGLDAISTDGEVAFTITDDTKTAIVYVYLNNGFTASNLVVKPMIKLAEDTVTEHTPYAMTNRELTEAVQAVNTWKELYNGDCDNLPNGVAYVGSSATHKPDAWCVIQTFYKENDPTDAIQFAYKMNTGSPFVWIRAKTSGTWGNWFKFTGTEQT